MNLGNLSSEAQAEVNGLFGMGGAPEANETEETAVSDEVESPEVDEELETDSQPEEQSDEESGEELDSDEEDSQSSEADIEYIKANGKKIKVDFNDREQIKRVTALAAGARQWQVERDNLQKQFDGLNEEHGKLKEVMDYLEENKDDHEKVFEAVTGMSLEEKFQQWASEQNMINTMSESEKELYLSNVDHQKRMKEVERREAALKAKLDQIEAEKEKTERAKQASIANPIFFKYNFDNELGDANLEHRLNRTLWNEAKHELAQLDEVTPDAVEEAFQRISNQLRAGFAKSSSKVEQKATAKRRKVVKEKAQKMAIKPEKSNKQKELDEKLRKGDIAGILAGGFDLSNYKR